MQKKIVVIQTAFLGDLLLATPLLKNLKLEHPDSQITLVCKKGLGEIFLQFRLCDQLVEVDKTDEAHYQKSLRPLLNQTFDLLFCPHESSRSHLLAKKINSEIKIGFKNFWNFLIFNQRVARDMRLPDALRQLSMLKPMDNYLKQRPDKIILDNFEHRYIIPESESMGVKRRILAHPDKSKIVQKFRVVPNSIFVAPGSVWNTKRWTPSGFRQLIQELSKDNPVVLVGSSQERELCEEIALDIPNVINLAGHTSLMELSVLLTFAKLLVSNDSGSMHLGSFTETPTVSIFGSTVLEQGYQPWNNRAVVVENREITCRPCGAHGHEKCPIGTHVCMTSISHEKVLTSLQNLLR